MANKVCVLLSVFNGWGARIIIPLGVGDPTDQALDVNTLPFQLKKT